MPSGDSKIPVVVCEYHQEVLQYIHRYIARKKLPFNDIVMVHFDSHPDLAFPQRLTADDVYCKVNLLAKSTNFYLSPENLCILFLPCFFAAVMEPKIDALATFYCC